MTMKRLTTRDCIRLLTLTEPGLSVDDVQRKLEMFGLPVPTTFLISQIRLSLRDHLRFLQELKLLRDREPIISPDLRRKLRGGRLRPNSQDRYEAEERDEVEANKYSRENLSSVHKLRPATPVKPEQQRPRCKLKNKKLIERRCAVVDDD